MGGDANARGRGSESLPKSEVEPATFPTRPFATLWDILHLEGDIAFDATIRPSFTATSLPSKSGTAAIDQTQQVAPALKAAAGPGLTLATLPRLSIDLRMPDPQETPAIAGSGDIVITGVLGEGGMGRVFLAHQRSLARDVAVKTVHEEVQSSVAEALVTEGLITGHLEHPNITPVHQLGVDARGRPLLVMKRIVGTVWGELIADPQHAAWKKLAHGDGGHLHKHIEVLMQVTNGVAFAHSRNVVHRDIKPENVMIGEFGETYLCDWGIAAKLPSDASHGLVGTPSYLAPEMLDPAGEIGPWTDVYLLGGTLHTILTGRPRHEGSDIKGVLEHAFESRPVDYPESVPVELAELANRATAHDPKERMQTAVEFRDALAAYLSHETSRTLSRAATDRLPTLGASGETDRAETLRKLIECRFGFAEALKAWPDNEEARFGFDCALALQLELELANENLSGARAVLADMAEPDPMMADRVAALAKKLEARDADAARLRRMQYEHDASVGASARRTLIGILLAVGVTMAAGLAVAKRVLSLSPDSSFLRIGPPIFILVATLIGFYVGRKQLLRNVIGRRMARLVLADMAFEIAHRVESFWFAIPIQRVMATDTLIACVVTACGAIFMSRWFLLPTVFLLASNIVILALPRFGEPVYIASHMALFLFIAFVWDKMSKESLER